MAASCKRLLVEAIILLAAAGAADTARRPRDDVAGIVVNTPETARLNAEKRHAHDPWTAAPQGLRDQAESLFEACSGDMLDIYAERLLGGCLGTSRVDGFPLALPDDSLERGLRAVGARRLRRMVDKLRSGEPLTVLLLGGSQSARNGGCWGRGCRACPLEPGKTCPGMRLRNLRDTTAHTMPSEPGRPIYSGFLSRFMQYINMTFPQAGHRAINNAHGGLGADAPMRCPASFLSPDADLVIMEHAMNGWEKETVEKLMGAVMRLPKQPAVLLINFFEWCPYRHMGNKTAELTLCKPEMYEGREHKVMKTFLQLERHYHKDTGAEAEATELAERYGAGSVSLLPALSPILMQEPPPPQLWPPIKFIDNLGLHSSHYPDWFSSYNVYAGDLLVHWLHTAVANHDSAPEEEGGEVMPPSPGSVLGCFNWLGRQGVHPPEIVSTEASPLATSIPDRYKEVIDGDMVETWFLVQHPLDGDEHVRQRTSWGLVSLAPGAAVNLKLHIGNLHASPSSIKVEYLTSYAHVGLARMQCVDGCTCDSLLVDARVADGFSGEASASLPVTSGFAEYCVVRVTNEERHDGFEGVKFKLFGLAVEALSPTDM